MYGTKGRLEDPPDVPESSLTSITLYTSRHKTAILRGADEWAAFLDTCRAAKASFVFKRFFGLRAQRNFTNEYEAFITLIAKLSPKDIRKHTAIKGISYQQHDVLGFSLHTSRGVAYFIVNERGDQSLQDMIERGEVNAAAFQRCFLDVLSAIIILTRCNLIHGDIKPSNIMFFKKAGTFKLIDWDHIRTIGDYSKYGPHPIYFDKWRVLQSQVLRHYVQSVMCPASDAEYDTFYSFIKTSWGSYAALRRQFDDPRTLRASYSHSVDTYAAGLILYAMCKKLGLPKEVETLAHNICIFAPGVIVCPITAYNICCKLFSAESCEYGRYGKVYSLHRLRLKSLMADLWRICGCEATVTLHTSSGHKVICGHDQIMHVIKRDAQHIAKEFKTSSWSWPFQVCRASTSFENELVNLQKVQDIYRGNETMTALSTLKYKTHIVYGVSCNQNYVIINKRGNFSIVNAMFTKESLRALYANVAASLRVLHAKGYLHRDIKPENIVQFDDEYTYRLIDWGKLTYVASYDPQKSYHGSSRTGSPVGFFFSEKRPHALTHVERENMHEFQVLSKSATFMARYKRVVDRFAKIFESSLDPSMVFQEWKFNIDLFSFGMTILYIMQNCGIKDTQLQRRAYALLTAKNLDPNEEFKKNMGGPLVRGAAICHGV